MNTEILTVKKEVVAKLEDLSREFKDLVDPIERATKIPDFFDAVESWLVIKNQDRPRRPKQDPAAKDFSKDDHLERIKNKGHTFEELDSKFSFLADFTNEEIDYLRNVLLKF